MNRRNLVLSVLTLPSLSVLGACATVRSTPAFSSERIAVSIEGSGTDVILIPGLTSHPEIWDTTTAHLLGTGHRVHRVWVSGFAGRPAGANAAGDDVGQPVAEEIARYIHEQGLVRPAIVGHSMGGWIGMVLAARHPDLVGRLMVVDMLPFLGMMFGPPGATPEQVRPIAELTRNNVRSVPLEQRRARAEATINGMIQTEARREQAIQHILNSDYDVAGRAFYELIVTDLRPELTRISVPMVVLYAPPAGVPMTDAQLDALYTTSFVTRPATRLVRIPDSAHFIMFDNPTRFFSELDAFLSPE
ncbi:alpha/beta fold hydrolase [Brevundimonas aveniformis]|uniref:alpha/beta fold hydrolase n=1 Tax=Brevundimonas aveniformis TaxID=370977 RepID=UPI0004147045|nr:alpha/beta hydrolase [Brevundimonas aveniformis]